MLYDPKWEQKTEVDPLSIAGLIAWLEQQPPKAKYNYWNCEGECLYGQYMTAMGISWLEAAGHSSNTPIGKFESRVYGMAIAGPRTFGAALKRARSLMTDD